jgi:5-hydroxyisourate hydrolase-like protein (transthyretin family)
VPRTRCLLSSACLAAGLVVALSTGVTLPAMADDTDGTLTVTVDRDVDGNGTYDPGTDKPQSGIGITVSDSSGVTVHGVTDDDGKVVLEPNDKLSGGRYFVAAEIPNALSDLTPVPESSDFQAMSTSVDVTSESQSVRMGVAVRATPTAEPPPEAPAPAAESVPDLRTEAPRFAVGDLVWKDNDRSGRQEPGEPAGSGISVQLVNGRGDVVQSTKTSSAGRYAFDRLVAGTYSVRFAGITPGYKLATSGRGDDQARDSDPDYTGETPPFTLGVDEANVRPTTAADQVDADYINPTIDAGITPIRYAVADRVWLDVNRDGIQQPGEPAAEAKVSLLTPLHTVLATTTTDAQGHYQFTDLKAGRYRLQFTSMTAHRAWTKPRAGDNAASDSDADAGSGETPIFKLDQNARDLVPAADVGAPGADLANATLGAGLIGVYSLGDTLWRDNNANGVLDVGDGGVKGVTVQLEDSSQHVLATKVTSSNGRFTFDSLAAGSYALHFVNPPAGLVFSPQHVGGNPAVDSDANAEGRTPLVTIGDDNPADTTIDAGLTTRANLQVAAAASGAVTPKETTLSSTGGVAAGIPIIGVLLVIGGVACLLLGHRGFTLPGGIRRFR